MAHLFRKGLFSIEDWLGPFEGWTAGESWNGWDCPYFEREVAMQIAEVWEQLAFSGEVFQSRYDEDQDRFCFRSNDSDWECFGRQIITVEDRQITVYAIGAYAWVWQEDN